MIDSPQNPMVRALRELHSPKGRKEQRRFLVEGVRLVADALEAGWQPSALLYNADALKKTTRGIELLRAVSDPRLLDDVRGGIQEASERAIAAASTTQHPQAVIASFRIPDWELPVAANSATLVLISDNVQDPGNLGTILRTAEAAGVSAVLLTRETVDLYNPKVVRAGMGAHFRLPTFPELDWAQIHDLLGGLSIPNERLYGTEAGSPRPYDAIDWTQPTALIISNEAHGLTPEAQKASHENLITIPMLGNTESLNAAMAATVILFEAARQRRG